LSDDSTTLTGLIPLQRMDDLEGCAMDSDTTFRTSRRLPHPPRAVYDAFAVPELLAAWWGPEGFTNTFERFEFRVGGRWTFQMHGPDGKSYPNQNVFVALEPGRRIVIRHDCAPYFTLTAEFTAKDGGTRITWEQAFDDARTAQAVRAIVVPANEQNLDRLIRVLGRAAPGAEPA
jgi:uncharacterized protein YndB with AHSA1/START domain